MRWFGILSGYGYLGLSLLIVIEIIGRKVLNTSIQGVDEIGGYVVAVTGTFGMALATSLKAHTRLDVIFSRLSSSRQALMNLLAYLALAASALFMAYMAWLTLADSLSFNSRTSTPLQTPLWLPQSLWLAGLVFFALIAGVLTGRAVLLICQARVLEANDLIGITKAVEETDKTER